MNTPAHLLLGAAAFGRRGSGTVMIAALIGAMLPDLSLYLMAGTALFILQIAPSRVFNELYFSDAWQTVFAIDNSFVIWGVLLGGAIWSQRGWAVALCGAALLHLVFDFPLHHDDGRPHFWPVSGWVFESPLSYWDVRHGARWVAPFEAAAAMCSAVLLLKHQPGVPMTVFILILLAAELWVVRTWLFFFIDSV
ncbi:MAG: cobalamin biosynthesis protein CobQ [Aliishimia sp.]